MLSTAEKQLIAAIHAAPNEDTPRLMYADEVALRDEQKAEFIRIGVRLSQMRHVQCTLNCKTEGPPGPIWCHECGHDPKCCNCELHESRYALKQRQNALLAAHPEWLPDCPEHTDRFCSICDGKGHFGLYTRGILHTIYAYMHWVYRGGAFTPWAKKTVKAFPELAMLLCTDRQPVTGQAGFAWSCSGNGVCVIPQRIWKRLSKRAVGDFKWYDTYSEAIEALAETLMEELRND